MDEEKSNGQPFASLPPSPPEARRSARTSSARGRCGASTGVVATREVVRMREQGSRKTRRGERGEEEKRGRRHQSPLSRLLPCLTCALVDCWPRRGSRLECNGNKEGKGGEGKGKGIGEGKGGNLCKNKNR